MTTRLPLFPLGTVLFPDALLPLHVFEPRYRELVQDLMAAPEPRCFGVVAIREGRETGVDGVRALHDVGCVAEVKQVHELPDGRYALATVGTRRFRLGDLDRSLPYLQGEVELLDEPVGDAAEASAAATQVRTSFSSYAGLLAQRAATTPADVPLPAEPLPLSYAVAAALAVDLGERQALLAAPDAAVRLTAEAALLARELGVLQNLRAVPAPDLTRMPRSLN